MLVVAPTARVSPLADLEDSVRGSRIVIEDDVVIDAFVKIKPVGGVGDIVIGRGCRINSGTVIYSGNGVAIGEGVAIASNCTIAPTNHEFVDSSIPIREQGFRPSRGGIVIESGVWIGSNSVLLDGARLGAGSVVGACSMVNSEIPPLAVCWGIPARVTGWRS